MISGTCSYHSSVREGARKKERELRGDCDFCNAVIVTNHIIIIVCSILITYLSKTKVPFILFRNKIQQLAFHALRRTLEPTTDLPRDYTPYDATENNWRNYALEIYG